MTGNQVAAGLIGANVIRTDSVAANTVTIEIQRSAAVSGPNVNANGVSHFNSSQFTVDSSGFVALAGGGLAVDSIAVQATTAPGVSPVDPTSAGLITIDGAAVAAQTIPVQSRSIALNSLQVEVQRASASATTNTTQQGLASFDSSSFTVDANGWVEFSGTSLIGITDTGSPFEVALGFGAGDSVSGVNNTLIGYNAGTSITSGTNHTAVGYNALSSLTTTSGCVAVGTNSLAVNTAANITAVGFGALDANTSATANTAVGYNALGTTATGSRNTAVGSQALENNIGDDNDSFGAGSLFQNTTGDRNVGVGRDVLREQTTGNDNTAVGYTAMGQFSTSTSFSNSTAIGSTALYANQASNNTAVGKSAMASNTTGDSNVAVGTEALDGSTTVSGNVAIGYQAASGSLTGDAVTAVGYHALLGATGGAGCTAIGTRCMDALTTGQTNTAVGAESLSALTTTSNNTAIGYSAMASAIGSDLCVAVGAFSLTNVTGDNNVGVGYNVLSAITSATGNIALGDSAGSSLTTNNSNNIDIGNAGVSGDSGVIRIGTSAVHTSAYMQGVAGVTVSNQSLVTINTSTGQLGSSGSYAEGTFTPGIAFGGATTGITYSAAGQYGKYTRIGNIAYINIQIELTSKGTATGNASITGLPFTVFTSSVGQPQTNTPLYEQMVLDAGYTAIVLQLSDATTIIAIQQQGGGSSLPVLEADDTNFTDTTLLNISAWYFVA